MAVVEADSMAEAEADSMAEAAGLAAGAASGAERDSAAAAGFVAARSAEERDFAEGQDFAVEDSAAAFAVMASAAVGAGADAVGIGEAGPIGVGPDTRIRMDMGTTTRGGRRLITRPAMIPTAFLTTSFRPPILRLATRIEIIHTGPPGTGLLPRRARRRDPATGTSGRRRPHRGIPGRRRRIPTVRRAKMA